MGKYFGLAVGLALVACGDPEAQRRARNGNPSIEWQGGRAQTDRPTPAEPLSPQPVAPEEPAEPPPAPIPATYPLDDVLRINNLQARGTHNSYHQHPLTNNYLAWQYDMPPLREQLTQHGIRAFELDVHAENGGFPVYHIATDNRTTCTPLEACLHELLGWSQTYRQHVPMVVFFELKGPWSTAQLDALDALIGSVVPAAQAYRPDDMMGDRYPDVLAAMQDAGWPTLGALRGRFIFALMASDALRYHYTREGRSLRGRSMFVADTLPGSRHSVILTYDYSVEQEQAIQDAVRRGFLVRTRLDNYPDRIQDPWATYRAALRSGAHFLLTDYPTGTDYFPSYDSALPDGNPVRCNPVAFVDGCTAKALESLWGD